MGPDRLAELRTALAKPTEAIAIVSTTPANELDTAIIDVMLHERGMHGIIVCIDRTPHFYQRLLAERSIPPTSVSFFDVTGSNEKDPTITSVPNASDLNSISIEFFKLVGSVVKKHQGVFVLFDGLPSLRFYTAPDAFARFLHVTSVRLRGLKTIQIYTLDRGDGINANIKKLCDDVIDIGSKPEEEFAAALGADV